MEKNKFNFRFYLSTLEDRPGERHLYSVSGKKIRFSTFTKCLTCHEGNSCLYNNAIFSPNGEFYVLECLGPDVPKIQIRSIYNQTFGNFEKLFIFPCMRIYMNCL